MEDKILINAAKFLASTADLPTECIGVYFKLILFVWGGGKLPEENKQLHSFIQDISGIEETGWIVNALSSRINDLAAGKMPSFIKGYSHE